MERSNFLIAAGTGRNVGKTTFVCKLILALSNEHPVTAVKITPHFHAQCDSCQTLQENENFRLALEMGADTGKDSAKMLKAGAKKVFYLQVKPGYMKEAVADLLPLLPMQEPVICESAELVDYVTPGLFVLLSHNGQAVKNADKLKLAQVHIWDYNYNTADFSFKNTSWVFKGKHK